MRAGSVGYGTSRVMSRGDGSRRGSCSDPHRRIHPCRCLAEISFAHDVVTGEHRACLVTEHLHHDAFGHASAYHVACRGSAEVVRDATLEPRGLAGGHPGVTEEPDPLTFAVEDVRARRPQRRVLRPETLEHGK